MRQALFFFFTSLYFLTAQAFDCASHIQYQKGDVPILLTSPHGASKSQLLPDVPLRTGKQVKRFVNRADQHTDKITLDVSTALKAKNLKPYVVVAGINRAQIDFNRISKYAYENPKAAKCYQRYHELIGTAIKEIRSLWSQGLMFDIHGQSKYNQYEILRGTRNQQTIKALLERYSKDVTESENGFFSVLRQQAYVVHPAQGEKERFYYGGYTLKTYGSHNDEGIDAIQIEINRDIRVDKKRRKTLVEDLTVAIEKFYRAYYLSSK